MLTICVGPNGSGKSLWALHQVIRFLRDEDEKRLIVTTLALNMDRLNEYLQEKYGEKAVDLMGRVWLISGEQMRHFWRFRGVRRGWTDGQDEGFAGVEADEYGAFIDVQDKGVIVEQKDPRWTKVERGVIYVLDEIQTQFGARDWQKTGPEFMAYQSQHRKFGDDVIAIAPSSALIDKQFRILSGECVTLQNWYKLKVGLIKAPRKIHYTVYQNCPPAPGEQGLSSGSFRIDGEGLASCYNTAAGLGIMGKEADKGKEAKGLPFWSIFVMLLLAGVAAWFVFSRVMIYAAHAGAEKAQIAKPVASVSNAPASTGVGNGGAGAEVGTSHAPPVKGYDVVTTNKVRVTGVWFPGGDVNRLKVVLSDGAVYRYHECDWISDNAVSIKGRVYDR